MKRLLSVLACVLLVTVMGFAAAAEEPTDGADPTTGGEVTTVAEEPEPTTTAEDPVTTVAEEPETTTAPEIVVLSTSMRLMFVDGRLTVRVTDENGEPVNRAPIRIVADGVEYNEVAGKSGTAMLKFDAEPMEIYCSTKEFQSGGVKYAACAASVVLHTTTGTEPVTTTKPTTVAVTTAPTSVVTQTPTEPVNTAPSRAAEGFTRVRTTGQTLTTTDHSDAEITEIVAVQTTTTAMSAALPHSRFPHGMALWLMIGGVVLLLGAAAVAYFFLIRAPRAGKEEKSDTPSADGADDISSATTEDAAEAVGETDDAAKEPEGTVSLEDLFRDL